MPKRKASAKHKPKSSPKQKFIYLLSEGQSGRACFLGANSEQKIFDEAKRRFAEELKGTSGIAIPSKKAEKLFGIQVGGGNENIIPHTKMSYFTVYFPASEMKEISINRLETKWTIWKIPLL